MDDQVFQDEILAVVFPDGVPGEEPTPSDNAENVSLQSDSLTSESEQTEDSTEPLVAEEQASEVAPDPEVQTESLDPVWAAEKAAYEAEIAESRAKQQAENERRAQYDAMIAQAKRDQEETRAQEIAQQLADWDPGLHQQYVEGRTFLAQERDIAMQRAGMTASALDAFALAMEHEAPDRADAIVKRAQELLQYGDSAQRVAVLERERGTKAAVAQELAQRDATIRELQARLEAQGRAPGADAVQSGGGPSGSSWTDRWAAATTLDEGFEAFRESLPPGW